MQFLFMLAIASSFLSVVYSLSSDVSSHKTANFEGVKTIEKRTVADKYGIIHGATNTDKIPAPRFGEKPTASEVTGYFEVWNNWMFSGRYQKLYFPEMECSKFQLREKPITN